MAPVIAVLVFLINVALFIAQSAAIGAGIHAWLGWEQAWAVGTAVLMIWFIPVPFVTGIAGILGAHYGWHWSWLASIALFAGPTALVLVLQTLFMGGAKLMFSVKDAWNARKAAQAQQQPPKLAAIPTKSTKLSWGTVAIALAIGLGSYGLVKESSRSTAASTRPNTSWAAGLDPKLKPAIDRFQARLTSSPEFMAFAKNVNSRSDATAKGIELSSKGILKLSTSDLERRAAISLLMLNAADSSTCSTLARAGSADGVKLVNTVYALLAKQSPSVIDEWFDLVYSATMASLKGLPDRKPSEQEIGEAMRRALTATSPTQRKAVQQFYQDPAAASDSVACQAVKAIVSSSLAADPLDRAVLVRALAME